MVGEPKRRAAGRPQSIAGRARRRAAPTEEAQPPPSVTSEPKVIQQPHAAINPSVTRERLLRQQSPPARARTPRPVRPTEDPQPEGPAAGMLAERMQQLRYLQDFFQNPVPFDLREKPLETSSSPQEIMHRVGEVKYQVQVLKALLVVLNEELETLNSALPAELKAESQEAGQT